jgi:phage tail protein X
MTTPTTTDDQTPYPAIDLKIQAPESSPDPHVDSPDVAEPAVDTAEVLTEPPASVEPQAPQEPDKPQKPKQKKPKPQGPTPQEIVRRVGDTNAKALAYVRNPDPQLQRLSRKVRETLITELPPVTVGALLGPAALARHFIASAASGRYRDLFCLWELFRFAPEECRPVLAERQRALEKAREALTTAVRLGLIGRAERVAEDISSAQGLIWHWLHEVLVADLPAVGSRPAVAAALLTREPDLDVPLPEHPSERWLAEAAAIREQGNLPPKMDQLLAEHAERLPATVATLQLACSNYPDRLPALLERVDLEAPDIGATLAWARDHGAAEHLYRRIQAQVHEAAIADRSTGLALWQQWRDRGIQLELPEPLRIHSLEGLDVSRPETAALIAQLIADGADIQPQKTLDCLAQQNRQLAEKAYEAFVCAGLDVRLPLTLEGNPIVKDGTRCPYCQAWTWVRPGHERRCPRIASVAIPADHEPQAQQN